MNPDFQNYLLQVTQSSGCKEIEIIQSLWSGYGTISRYQLSDSTFETVVVKNISLSQSGDHPRGWNTNNSHNRKVKSYEVETNWYEQWSAKTDLKCKVPAFIGAYSEGKDQWIILEDLDANFPRRKQDLKLSEVKACLKWLANFHATFLGENPVGLWQVGTYWHLETRPDEFKKIQHSELKAKAHIINDILNQCTYQTIVHGDAKLANFCFSEDGTNIAAVDFQYVGGGCGMKDVAYFIGSCLSNDACERFETELLDFYFTELQQSIQSAIDFNQLEEEWRRMYPIAVADFTRFLLGWMPTHQKVNDYSLRKTKEVLISL